MSRTEEADNRYSNPDNDPRGVWKGASFLNPATPAQRPNLCYPITNPNTGMITNPTTNAWRRSKGVFEQLQTENRLYWGIDGKRSVPAVKMFLSEARGLTPVNLWMHDYAGNTDQGTLELAQLMGAKVFDNPKPSMLIWRALEHGSDDDSIVVDFFSGSATTAHAVMQLNAEDGGNRRFILVQYPESCDEKSEASKAGYPNICEIGKERIRRAGEKIKADVESANDQLKIGEDPKPLPDIGFKVFRTADTNIRWTHMALEGEMTPMEIHAMQNDKEKLDFMPGFTDIDVVYEVLLRQRDIPLSAKVEKLNIGSRTYLFADAYIVCLDDTVTRDMVEQLAAVEPTPIKYVFRDSAFDDNISLKDETIRRLEAYIARNSGEQKKAYTVEFI